VAAECFELGAKPLAVFSQYRAHVLKNGNPPPQQKREGILEFHWESHKCIATSSLEQVFVGVPMTY